MTSTRFRMDQERARRAAHNNARWCDAVCRAHGGDTAFAAAAWLNRRPSPPYYPNLVTLEPDAPSLPALAAIPLEGTLGVKDSFARFDLSNQGFAPLFDAQWIWREPAAVVSRLPGLLQWSTAGEAAALADWEAAWWRGVQDEPPPLHLFPPMLLAERGLRFLMGRRPGGAVVAGAALLHTDGVAGLACTFLPDGAERAQACAEMLRVAQSACPGAALVGYESGDALRFAEEVGGFQRVGALRVWLRRPA